MTEIEQADQVAADLVHACYGKFGSLAMVIRMEGDTMRVIAPADYYEALALMAYRAGDELAAHAAPHRINLRD